MISNQKNKPKTNVLEKTCSCVVLNKDENTICEFAIKAQGKDEVEREKNVHNFMEGCKSIKTLSKYKTLIIEDDISSIKGEYFGGVTAKNPDGTASYELSLYVCNKKAEKRCMAMFIGLVNFIMQAEKEAYKV